MTEYLVIRPAPWAHPGPVTLATPCLCDQYPGVWEYPRGWAGLALRQGRLLLLATDNGPQVRDPRAVMMLAAERGGMAHG